MVKFFFSMTFITMALMISGCKDDEPNRTVEHYLDNAGARAATLEKCETMDNAATEANCINAQKATKIHATETNRENRSDAVNSLFGTGG